MIQPCKRPSTSPLIDPALCCLVLIAPTQSDLTCISQKTRVNLRRNVIALVSAADILNVPIFLCSPGLQAGRHGFVEQLHRTSYREFSAMGHNSWWQNIAFTEALKREDRPVLVLAGFWLEHEVLAAALHAVADSFEVYIPMDATPARRKPAVLLCQDRLIQAGGTPVIISQIIHEWLLDAPDKDKRDALAPLLARASSSD